ncbi:MAG: winged helix-turn-helix domain-containing protein [Thermoanaerobaculia bacterium]|nr:winged helix-turn-helix domain-containing protein [Thermoanaerobaculia bacterium]
MRLGFDDFELDTATYALSIGGKPIRVEPRVFELLSFLLRERHRLVTKDELVAAVWGGQFVGDTALARCVYMARQALGDDSNQQRYIKTVHGRGYRFDDAVEVREIEKQAAESPKPSEDSLPRGDGRDPADPTAREVVSVASPDALPPDSAGVELPATASNVRDQAVESPRRGWIGLVIKLALAALLASGLLYLRSETGQQSDPDTSEASTPASAAEPRERAGSVGLSWSAVGPDSEAALTALSLADLLTHRLEEIDGLTVRNLQGDRATALTDEASLAAAFDAAGNDMLLIGQVTNSSLGDRFLASAELYSREGERLIGSPLGQFEIPRLQNSSDLAAFLEVREAIAAQIARQLGLIARLTPDDPLAPTHAEAYRLSLLAQQMILEDFCGSSAAIGLLERSLELDPDFARGWELLAVAHYNMGWACGADPSSLEAVFAAADEAVRLAPHRVHMHLLRFDLLVETGRVEEAWKLRLSVRDLPESVPEVIAYEIYALTYAGFLEEAATRIARLLEIEPLYYSSGEAGESPNALLYLGDIERYLAIMPSFDNSYHRFYHGFAAFRLGDLEAARLALEPAFRANPGSVFGRLAQGLLAAIEGDQQGAQMIIEQLSRQRRELDSVDAETTYKQAQIFALAHDHDRALDNLERTVADGFFAYRAIRFDPAFGPLRGDPRFEATLDRARERHVAFADRFGLLPDLGGAVAESID